MVCTYGWVDKLLEVVAAGRSEKLLRKKKVE